MGLRLAGYWRAAMPRQTVIDPETRAELQPLAALRAREVSDPTIALFDGFAATLDVLSFYTERYAQEHYLRTATERLSVREMARLIGYRLAPGVAASTHLAFKLLEAPGAAPPEPILIPVGTRVQSVPGQDETAQSFETVAEIPARVQWNAMPVQTRVPWRPQSGDTELWLDGLATQLQPGDAILIVGSDRISDPGGEHWDVRVLSAVLPDNANARTRVLWNHPLGSAFPTMSPAGVGVEVHAFRQRTALFGHNAPDPNLLSSRGSNLAQKIDRSTPSNWTWKQFHINGTTVDLESANPKITAGTWFALVSNEAGLGSADLPGYTELYRAQRVSQLSRNDFGISGKTTRITPDTTDVSMTPDTKIHAWRRPRVPPSRYSTTARVCGETDEMRASSKKPMRAQRRMLIALAAMSRMTSIFKVVPLDIKR